MESRRGWRLRVACVAVLCGGSACEPNAPSRVEVKISGDGSGVVEWDERVCPEECRSTVGHGIHSFLAIPGPDSRLAKWSGDCFADGDDLALLDVARQGWEYECTAIFECAGTWVFMQPVGATEEAAQCVPRCPAGEAPFPTHDETLWTCLAACPPDVEPSVDGCDCPEGTHFSPSAELNLLGTCEADDPIDPETDSDTTGTTGTTTSTSATDDTGDSTSTSSDDSSGGTDTGEPAGGYGDCVNNPPELACVGEETCEIHFGDAGACSTPCTEDADCPPPPSGTAEPQCVANHCALVCTPEMLCPEGMACFGTGECVWEPE